MAFTFYYNSMPAGLGGALVAAGQQRASFARRIELARLQLERQGLEMQQARDLQGVEESQWRRQATLQELQQRQLEHQQQLGMEQARMTQQQGQFDAGLELDQAKMGQQQSQFDAGMAMDQRKLDLSEKGQIHEENRLLLNEYNMLQKAGAVPYSMKGFDPQRHVEYVDVKNRMWMMPKERLNPQQVQQWVAFAHNKLGRLEGELQNSSKRRVELQAAQATEEKALADLQSRLEKPGNEKTMARRQAAVAEQQGTVDRLRTELAGIRPAEVVQEDLDTWERQYQGWIGLLPPETQQALLEAAHGAAGVKAREGAAAARPLSAAERAAAAEEYARSRFGRR